MIKSMPLIRNLAVGLPVHDGYVLVSGATDSVKGEAFYRAIGGGIEFASMPTCTFSMKAALLAGSASVISTARCTPLARSK